MTYSSRWPEPVPAPEVNDLGDLAGVAELLRGAVGAVSPEDIRDAETEPADGALVVIVHDPSGQPVLLDVRTLFAARHARQRRQWAETRPAELTD